MANEAMVRCDFERLMCRIYQETGSAAKKLDILFTSRGYFSPVQASTILYAFANHKDKLKALEMMEPRLCRMTCNEARDIIGSFSIQNDKLRALGVVKRYICDTQVREGQEIIMGCYPFEDHKRRSLGILHTVRGDVFDQVPSGAHQGYAALGSLYTQCRPLVPHLYGSLYEQSQLTPGQGKVEVPTLARPTVLPSKYTGHPSYAFPQGRDYAEDRKYPGCGAYGEHLYYPGLGGECPAKNPVYAHYPAGATPLGMHHATAAPTAFQVNTSYN